MVRDGGARRTVEGPFGAVTGSHSQLLHPEDLEQFHPFIRSPVAIAYGRILL